MKQISLLSIIVLLAVGAHTQAQAQGVRFLEADPAGGTYTVKNFGDAAVDISQYRLCSLFDYFNGVLSGLTIVEGSLNLEPGASVTFSGWTANESAADLGLYLPVGDFGSADAMADFVQWGAGSLGRENVAVTKGIWTAGAFIETAPLYRYIGDGTQNGADFWQRVTSVETTALAEGLRIKMTPQPLADRAIVTIDAPASIDRANVSVVVRDIAGSEVRRIIAPPSWSVQFERGSLASGIYFMTIETGGSVVGPALKFIVL